MIFKTHKNVLFLLFCFNIISPHGFAKNTLIFLGNNQNFVSVQDISQRFFCGQRTYVESYKEKSLKLKQKQVQAVAYCQSNCSYQLSFDNFKNDDIFSSLHCSPLQEFYRISDHEWIPAYQLNQGDKLLCKDNKTTKLIDKQVIYEPVTIYIIEIKKYHTFFVTHQKILTHNMFIPVVTTLGISVPFDLVFHAGTWGCMFGPVTFCCSIAVAGITAAIIYGCGKEKVKEFDLVFESSDHINFHAKDKNSESDMQGAQAPGKPTEKDGFIPKKNWDGKKVPNLNGSGWGWPDCAGNVWIPSGPKGHGGPHWDVQRPGKGKKYANIVPGGNERGKK